MGRLVVASEIKLMICREIMRVVEDL